MKTWCSLMVHSVSQTAMKTATTVNSEKTNKDINIHWEDDASLLNVAMQIVKGSFRGWGETGPSPSSLPDPILCPCHRQLQPPLCTQVDTSLPTDGEAPHRWERQPSSMFPSSIPGTCPSQFYSTLPLHKVLLMDKYRLCKWVTSQKNPTVGLQPLSRLDSLSCPGSLQRDCWPQWCQRYVFRFIQKDSQGVDFFLKLYGCVVAEDSFIRLFPCFLKTCCSFVQVLWTVTV